MNFTNMKLKFILLLIFSLSLLNLNAQNTEIILLQMSIKDTSIALSNPVNISMNKGYDNQPYFTEDGKSLIYTSKRDSLPTEIYEYNIQTKKTKRLTQNSENEYSPKLEGYDQKLTVVKGAEQRLIKYKDDYSTEDTILVLKDSIGYYEQLSSGVYIVYTLSKPHSLNIVDTTKLGEIEMLTERPGKTFYKYNDKGFLYVEKGKTANEPNQIKWYLKAGKIYNVGPLPEGNEFFCIHENYVYAVWDNKLWECNLMEDRMWHQKSDLSKFNFEQISRIAINPHKNLLALVVNETEMVQKLVNNPTPTKNNTNKTNQSNQIKTKK